MGDKIGQGLKAMIPRFEFLKEVRWRGLMIGIEFGPPKSLTLKPPGRSCTKWTRASFRRRPSFR
jgi:4-aminobutyrate aminotransferase-like enzyme